MSGKIFVISAPSGAGKTTLVRHSLERLQEKHLISRVVTYTTKPPREGEAVHGVDYYYLTQAEFEKKIAEGFFIEWSCAYGHYYGSPSYITEQVKEGRSFVLIVDRAGAHKIKEFVPEAVLIWIYTSSVEVLRQRIVKRGGDCPKQIERRLQIALQEIEQESVRPLYNFHVLNEDFCESLEKLYEIFKLFLKDFE